MLKIIGSASVFLGVIGLFIPADTPLIYKVVSLLACFLVACGIKCIELYIKAKAQAKQIEELQHDLANVKERHTALGEQYNEKANLVEKYKRFTGRLTHMIVSLLAQTDSERLSKLYDFFLSELNDLERK